MGLNSKISKFSRNIDTAGSRRLFLFIANFDRKIAVAIVAQSGSRPSPKSNAILFPLSYGN